MYPLHAFVEHLGDQSASVYAHLGRAMVGRSQVDKIDKCLVFESKEAKHLDWLSDQLSKILPHCVVIAKDSLLCQVSNPRSVIFCWDQKEVKNEALFNSIASGESIRLGRQSEPAVSMKIDFVPIFLTLDATTLASNAHRMLKVQVTKVPDETTWTKKAQIEFVELCLGAYDTVLLNRP